MKRETKFMLFALVFSAILGLSVYAVPSAHAAELIIQNTLDNDVDIAVLYFDRASGTWTTRGWVYVKGNEQRSVKYNNVDESKGMYYFAHLGKTIYVDEATLTGDPVRRWVSGDGFNYDFPQKPSSGKNLRTEPFRRCRYSKGAAAFILRIDTRPVG